MEKLKTLSGISQLYTAG